MIKNALMIFFICAAVFIFFLPSYLKMQELSETNLSYEKKIADLEHDNVQLREERRRLAEDPAYFEKVARERMGIIKDGEVIYKVVGPGQKKSQASPETAGLIRDVADGLASEIDPFADDPLEPEEPATVKKTQSSSTKTSTKTMTQKRKTQ